MESKIERVKSKNLFNFPPQGYYDEDLKHVRSDIKGLYKLVEDIKETNKILQEEQKLLSETNVPLGEDPPDTKNSDPLTPLNQNFVTLDQLQKHYKTFVERVQYQLASIGGGGETRLQYLDDIVGIATNLNAYDGMVLQVDVNGPAGKKFKFGGSVGAGGTWASNTIGVSTTKNVGIATTARTDFALYVGGDQYVDGNVTIGGTLRTENKINVDSIGIVTARTQINVGYDYESGPGVGVTILSSGSADYAGIVTASTVKASTAFYPPLYTTTARDAETFSQGAIIFNTTSLKLEFYDGTSWQSLPGMTLGLTVALDG